VSPVSLSVGDAWNESEAAPDPLTGRTVRRLTTRGRINQTPTYHTGSGFTADGRWLAFASVREGATWVLRAEAATGELRALWRAPGVGDRNYIHRGMGLAFDDVDGRGICGNRVCVAPRSRTAVFTCERRLIALDMATLDERVLIDDCGEEWIFGAPCVSPDERWVAVALSSAHPQMLAGEPVTRGYREFPDHRLRIVRVPLGGDSRAEPEVIFEQGGAQSAHCAWCPADDNLLYFDLDLPPHYWSGGDGRTTRVWLLEVDSGRARPLADASTFAAPFQTHTAWLWDGSALAYHGSLPGGGIYMGVRRHDGEPIWQRSFPEAVHYGHLTPDAKRRALVLDGDLSADRLQWLHYEGDNGYRLEPIALHSTEWGSLPGQYSHPHPITDPTGRWISFTSARAARSDVNVVDIG